MKKSYFKKIFGTILLICLSLQFSWAQENPKFLCKQYYLNGQYKESINAFYQIDKNKRSFKLKKVVGLSYAKLHQSIEALVYLLEAYENKAKFTNKELSILGDVLQSNNRYLAAIKIYKLVQPIPQNKINACTWALNNNDTDTLISIVPFHHDLHPLSYSVHKQNIISLLPYYDSYALFSLKKKRVRKIKVPFKLPNNFNCASFNKDSTVMYFSSNASQHETFTSSNKKKRRIDKKGINNLFIWQYHINTQKSLPVALPFNNTAYSCAHPFFCEQTKRLYFASNMPGGYGGFDIYYSELKKNGWSQPVNMGSIVNTSKNEAYPAIFQDKLYFASRGHIGYGGYDLFVYDLTNTDKKVVNLGLPVNSSFDDFSIQFQTDSTGFFISKRNNPKGINKLYRFNKLIIPSTEITIPYSEELASHSKSTQKDSLTQSGIHTDKRTEVTPNLTRDTIKPTTIKKETQLKQKILITRAQSDSTAVALLEKQNKKDILPLKNKSKEKAVPNKQTRDIFTSQANNTLAKGQDLNSNQPYYVVATSAPIFFEYNKTDIETSEKSKLLKVINYYQNRKNIILNIEGHTDKLGSDKYNKGLSLQRAKSVALFLIENGIPAKQILIDGKGEHFPMPSYLKMKSKEANTTKFDRRVNILMYSNDNQNCKSEN